MSGSLHAAQRSIEEVLSPTLTVPRPILASLVLSEDTEIIEWLQEHDPDGAKKAQAIAAEVRSTLGEPAEFRLAQVLRERSESIASRVTHHGRAKRFVGESIDPFLMDPRTGWIVLAAILYFGFYQFVGVFGAGTVVDFLEDGIFGGYINPFFTRLFTGLIPWSWLRELFVGEYGVLTLGVRYAVSLILPIVTFFFIAFSVVEDSGYLPRLAMLLDRIFKRIGLSGRAVIPMVLGLGCVTMATLVTRTLPTRRERVIATILLSLAVPCSAQLGVILGLLGAYPKVLLLWAATLLVIFLIAGAMLSRFMPGEAPSFYMELPPLRLPIVRNVLLKTWTRLKWYFWEVFPLFLLASVLIWGGRLLGIFDAVTGAIARPLEWVGLPAESSTAFLFGFFRRDYGAAGLYDLAKSGALGMEALYVSTVMLTLFLPCVAQFLVNLKERGWRMGLGISAFTLFFSYGMAWVLGRAVHLVGILR